MTPASGQLPAPAASPEPPSRYDGVTMRACGACGQPFAASGRRRWCPDACKQAAWRRRTALPEPPVPPPGTRRAVTVCQCDGCGYRALGIQRCDDCGTFMHAIGPGGLCPGCDEPVAAVELTQPSQ